LYYEVTFDVQDWFQHDTTEASFGDGKYGRIGAELLQGMFSSKLNALFASGYDFAPLDTQGWGVLDHLVIIHSGMGAEFGDPPTKRTGCDAPARDRIWSQGIASTVNGWNSADYAYTVSPFVLAGAFDPEVCSNNPANMGVITHEYMHGFDLPDLYDQDKDDGGIFIGGTGKFCLMSSDFGWGRTLDIPGHLSAWPRKKLGWVDPLEISVDGYVCSFLLFYALVSSLIGSVVRHSHISLVFMNSIRSKHLSFRIRSTLSNKATLKVNIC
jgi:M6 family metalloprotease-like protein